MENIKFGSLVMIVIGIVIVAGIYVSQYIPLPKEPEIPGLILPGDCNYFGIIHETEINKTLKTREDALEALEFVYRKFNTTSNLTADDLEFKNIIVEGKEISGWRIIPLDPAFIDKDGNAWGNYTCL
ncbi:MAG: hypothetical protein ABIJ92_02950 [Candidatus Aenigmatarchaeota archaeon]